MRVFPKLDDCRCCVCLAYADPAGLQVEFESSLDITGGLGLSVVQATGSFDAAGNILPDGPAISAGLMAGAPRPRPVFLNDLVL